MNEAKVAHRQFTRLILLASPQRPHQESRHQNGRPEHEGDLLGSEIDRAHHLVVVRLGDHDPGQALGGIRGSKDPLAAVVQPLPHAVSLPDRGGGREVRRRQRQAEPGGRDWALPEARCNQEEGVIAVSTHDQDFRCRAVAWPVLNFPEQLDTRVDHEHHDELAPGLARRGRAGIERLRECHAGARGGAGIESERSDLQLAFACRFTHEVFDAVMILVTGSAAHLHQQLPIGRKQHDFMPLGMSDQHLVQE